ncbi:MAG: hypothetical protein CMB99_09395 [Flavobacteriaceae bacterium]|nr:hypothetical protein [Flavobacteriaceae bacterium]|tara:strand:+ start:456447 stop:456698 length:252 start_codon:yes stop_codon:yes gene_type:complete
MKNEEKSAERLRGEIKVIRFITILLVVVLLALAITCIVGILTKEENKTATVLLVVPLALSPIIFLNLNILKTLKKALEKKEQG